MSHITHTDMNDVWKNTQIGLQFWLYEGADLIKNM